MRSLSGSYREAPCDEKLAPKDWALSLAMLLGATAYDLRLRLVGEAPWVIANTHTLEEARAMVSLLRGHGFGAVECELSSARPWVPPNDLPVALETERMTFGASGIELEYSRLRVIVRATVDAERGDERIEQIKVGSDARARYVVDVSHFSYARERDQAVYLFTDLHQNAARFTQSTLRVRGVVGVTSHERFDRFIVGLRAKAPGARYDQRFVARPRKRTSFSMAYTEGSARGSLSSNSGETDLAARLMALAFMTGQID